MLSSLIGSRKSTQGQTRPQVGPQRQSETFKFYNTNNSLSDDYQIKSNDKQHSGINGINDMSGVEQANINLSPLYGNDNVPPSTNFKISDKISSFRLVVVQDAGIRRKQPLFDSALPCNNNISKMNQKLNKNIYHSINELSLFMFGCYGIPISENNTTTKIHYLPSLSNLHSSILITRLFSLDSTFKLKPHAIVTETNEWETHPILDADELPFLQNASRFSIGMIIPVHSSIESVTEEITNNWVSISESLKEIQDLISSKLEYQYKTNQNKLRQLQKQNNQIANSNAQSLHSNKLSFSIYSLQTEIEIFQNLASFLRSLISLVETPRLFIDLKHSNQSLINWASNLSLWKELKDGRNNDHFQENINTDNASETFLHPSFTNHPSSVPQVKFLASLLALLIPYQSCLFNDSGSFLNENLFSNIRIIIGTGNPVVSEKLIFIISGIIGYDTFSKIYDNYETILNHKVNEKVKTSTNDSASSSVHSNLPNLYSNSNLNSSQHPQRSLTPLSYYPSSAIATTNVLQNSRSFSQTSSASSSSSPRTPLPFQRQETNYSMPIPISQEMKEKSPSVQTRSGSLYINSLGSSVEKNGIKSTPLCISQSPSIATVSASINTQRINTPLSRTSSYASLQCLSTSYGANVTNSIGSNTPSSSWRNNFGSFMDRWKNSITPSPTTSHFSQLSQPVTQFTRQDSISPSVSEYNEYPWFGKRVPNSPTMSSSSSFISSNNNNTTNRFTIKNNPHLSSYIAESKKLDIKRTSTKLIIPYASKLSESIKNEINNIMDGNFEYKLDDNVMKSVVEVSLDDTIMNSDISCVNEFELPLLTGYVPQFRSEFHLQSCNSKQLLESTLVETMRHDLNNLKCEHSEIFFINLGMHRITHFEMDVKGKVTNDVKSDEHSNYSQLEYNRSETEKPIKSNLTKYMECAKNLHQTTLLTSSKSLNNDLTQEKFNREHDIEERVEKVDQILEKIVWTITNFFYEINKNECSSDDDDDDEDETLNKNSDGEVDEDRLKSKADLENECCNEIRSLISKMLEIK